MSDNLIPPKTIPHTTIHNQKKHKQNHQPDNLIPPKTIPHTTIHNQKKTHTKPSTRQFNSNQNISIHNHTQPQKTHTTTNQTIQFHTKPFHTQPYTTKKNTHTTTSWSMCFFCLFQLEIVLLFLKIRKMII